VTWNSHEFQFDCSDWGHIEKHLSCLEFRTIYGSGPNFENIRFYLVCTGHNLMRNTNPSHIWAKKKKMDLGHICQQS